ncbi:MAG TPA: hypothetical protein VG501_09345 [Rhizomicrobium sp.]|nr:hypothetical protein [Rhizomicrobium sp.]
MIWLFAAALWGAAEASFFFIVPDVLLTYIALRFSPWRASSACSVAALFAGFAGAGMWLWGSRDPDAARAAMLLVPAVGPDLLARVSDELAGGAWPFRMLAGAVSGIPYKLYAVEAGARHVPLLLFLPISFVARLARFVLTTGFTLAARFLLLRMGKSNWAVAIWAFAWCLVYAVYFTLRAKAGSSY